MAHTDSRTLALQVVGSSGEALRGRASQEEVGPQGQQGLRAGTPSGSCLLAKSPPLSEQSCFRSQADPANSCLQRASHSSHQAFLYQDGLCPFLQALLNILSQYNQSLFSIFKNSLCPVKGLICKEDMVSSSSLSRNEQGNETQSELMVVM